MKSFDDSKKPSFLEGLLESLSERYNLCQGGGVAAIFIEPGMTKEEAIERYRMEKDPYFDPDDPDTIVFVMNYSGISAEDTDTKRNTKTNTGIPYSDTLSKPQYPPSDRYDTPSTVGTEEYPPENPTQKAKNKNVPPPEERPDPHDIVAEDFTEQERQKFGIKVSPMLQHRRYGKWSWMA